jgi:thymidylate kinase
MLISISGLDGVGKTTLAKALAQKLACGYLKFPDRNTLSGQVIAAALSGTRPVSPVVMQALQVCNRLERWPALCAARGSLAAHLVCDRYTADGLVYGMQDGLPEAVLRAWDVAAPAPDLAILLTAPCELIDGKRLAGRDREIYEGRGLAGLRDQEARFLALWEPQRGLVTWPVFDTSKIGVGEMIHQILIVLARRTGGER